MTRGKNYANVQKFLHDGYGIPFASALMSCVECYLPSIIEDGVVPGDTILERHWVLCTFLKILLKDEYGVDLDSNENVES